MSDELNPEQESLNAELLELNVNAAQAPLRAELKHLQAETQHLRAELDIAHKANALLNEELKIALAARERFQKSFENQQRMHSELMKKVKLLSERPAVEPASPDGPA